MERVISVRDVSWRREKETILKNINWEVKQRQHWAVLGLNGSGKTSLLNMVNGYIWPTTGQLEVLGQSFGKTDIRELRKSIGWVSSSLQARINGRHTTQDIVVSGKYASIGLHESPSDADYYEALEIMKGMNCSHLVARPYETCSTGEKQRILISRALMAKPELLILDEPSSGLDFIAREELMASIGKLAKEERAPTIILVTHHIEEVLPDFSRVLLLQDGHVFEQGQREEVLSSEKMSQFFERDIQVDWRSDRAWMTLRN